jgi:PhoPQ-activated pathogenicity-related protein
MKSRINTIISFTFFLFLLASCANQKKKTEKPVPVTPETALKSYLNNDDTSFEWELKDEYEVEELKIYELLLTSQKWREFTWKHQLTIIVPKETSFDGAMLFITGGSVKDGEPNWTNKDDKRMLSFTRIAAKNKAIVSIVRQTPNQPLYDGLVEDQLISYTLHNFKEDGDYTWPLLFPMVKTAVRAMDATQEFSEKTLGRKLKSFTVTGASKRGWTTWLTGANDSRVKAIAPMVIDVLNMPVSLDYQIKVWNEYSEQIEDYVKLEIPQQVHTESGDAITIMVDPYSYRKSLTMPKMIFIGTNDEYWPVDAIKNYYNDIPGENFIHYVPDAGHDLAGGEQALRALCAFWAYTLSNEQYPECSWEVSQSENGITLKVKGTPDKVINAYLWSADSEDRDFRDEKWQSLNLKEKSSGIIEKVIEFPENGYKAFYIDLKYKNLNGGEYTKSTRMFVVNEGKLL